MWGLVALLAAVTGLWAISVSAAQARVGSPNGAIAFSSPLDKRNGCDDIIGCAARVVYVNPNGTGRHKIPCAAREIECYDATPAFSPDGRFLATGTDGLTDDNLFSRDEVVIRRARGGRVVRRIQVGQPLNDIAWSGDSTRLAFKDASKRLRIMRRDGSGLHTYTRTRAEDVDWSRQGRLAWSGIFLTDSTRRKVRRYAPGGLPMWSPNGRRLLTLDDSGWSVVSARHPGGRKLVRLKRCYELEYGAAWSPDGRSVACGTVEGHLIVTRLATPRRARVVASGVRPIDIAWRSKPRGQ